MLTGPPGHFDLAIRHALLRADSIAFEGQRDIPATRRLINHANG